PDGDDIPRCTQVGARRGQRPALSGLRIEHRQLCVAAIFVNVDVLHDEAGTCARDWDRVERKRVPRTEHPAVQVGHRSLLLSLVLGLANDPQRGLAWSAERPSAGEAIRLTVTRHDGCMYAFENG